MADYSKFSNEMLLNEYNKRKSSQSASNQSSGMTNSPEMNQLIQKALGQQSTGQRIGNAAANAFTILGGGQPKEDNTNEFQKTYLNEAIKSSFKDPVENELKQARIKAINAGLTIDEAGNITKAPTPRDPNYLPPSVETRKIKATEGLYDTVNQANLKYGKIQKGMEAAPKLPQGLIGKYQLGWMKMFDTNNPTLGDWQNMKSLLQDAQLQQTTKTKGAISDQEMNMFAQAVANDDLASVMRQTNVLEGFKKAIFADQDSKINSFKRSFNDDPMQWEDLGAQNPFENESQDGISEEDVQFTMQKHGLSRQEVLRRLNG